MAGDATGRLAHYQLLEKIGQGGMGAVYRAQDTRLDRLVAVKLLLHEGAADPVRRRMLLREARTAAGLNHPNICTIHDVGEAGPDDRPLIDGQPLLVHPGTPFLVMELVEGETLRDLLDRSGSLPLHELVEVAAQVAEGLREAHAHRIVHRDLKPQNVVRGAGERWKILDFGLAAPARGEPAAVLEEATTVSAGMPQAGWIAGTVAYMSPEQLLARPVGRASDLFSFGTMLYEMAAGRKPFRADTVTATVAKILEAEPAPLSELKPDLPPALGRILARCLRKEAADRYADAGELLQDLRALRQAPLSDAGTPAASATAGSPDTIAVLPFLVRGDASLSYLSEGMVDLLSTNLDGAGELRSVDAHRVLCCAPRATTEPDPAEAAAMARGFGAGLFVLGNILEAGGSLHVRAALYEASGEPRLVSRAAVQGNVADIFRLVDALTGKLLASRSGGPDARLSRVAAATTASFVALKAYLEGEREMRAMRRDRAADAYRRALDEDPGFALAWYRLAVASLWSQRPHDAWDAVAAALRHADRLVDRDRQLLEAFAALLRGANDQAESLYRRVVGAYPDDVEAWFQLADLLFHHGPQVGRTICDSRSLWERLLALEPNHLSALVHLCAVAAASDDRELLDRCTRRVEEIGGGADSVLWARALRACALGEAAKLPEILRALGAANDLSVDWTTRFVGVYLGDVAAARPVAELLTEPLRAQETRVHGHVALAHLEVARGRWRAAQEELGRAGALGPREALEHRALLAAFPLLSPEAAGVEQARADLLRWEPEAAGSSVPSAPSALWLSPHEGMHILLRDYLAGLLGARLGDAGAVRPFVQELERWRGPEATLPVARGMADSLRAHAAWLAGDGEEAVRLLQRSTMQICVYFTLWSPFLAQDLERFTHAEWLRALGRLEEALPWYATFGENSVFDQIYYAPSQLRRGEIYERLSRSERAATHTERFLRLWDGCDAALDGAMDEARARLERLGGGRGRSPRLGPAG